MGKDKLKISIKPKPKPKTKVKVKPVVPVKATKVTTSDRKKAPKAKPPYVKHDDVSSNQVLPPAPTPPVTAASIPPPIPPSSTPPTGKVRSVRESLGIAAYKLPWVEQYRPKELKDIVSHDEKIKVFETLIARRELPHLLFYGPPGTGKTTLILAIAKLFYGVDVKKYMLELNASNDRGIDIIRNSVQTFARTASNEIRLIFLDEADAMTQDAQNALKKVIEDHTATCRFCLVCNDINKIDPGIQSRCAMMSFSPLKPSDIYDRVKYIVKEEHMVISSKALKAAIGLLGDFRQVLNKLQCLHNYHIGLHGGIDYPRIMVEEVYRFLRKAPRSRITDTFKSLIDPDMTFYQRREILLNIHYDNEWDLIDFVNDVSEYTCDIDTDIGVDCAKRLSLIKELSRLHYQLHSGHDARIVMTDMALAFTATS